MARNAKARTGPSGVLDQVTDLIGKTGGRAGKNGGGLTTNAASFMAGFLDGAEDRKGRGKRARGSRARGGRRR